MGISNYALKVVGLSAGVGVAIIGAALAFSGANKRRPETTLAAATPAAPEPVNNSTDARDVVRVLGAYHRLALAIGKADWTWATCQEKTVGYDALLKCETDVANYISSLVLKVIPLPVTGPCATVLEKNYLAYIESQRRFHADHLSWIAKADSLRAALTSKRMREACKIAGCSDEPIAFDEKKYGVTNFSQINGTECVTALFECSPPSGNVCWPSKVASRLGLEEGSAFGDLTIKSTGVRVTPLGSPGALARC